MLEHNFWLVPILIGLTLSVSGIVILIRGVLRFDRKALDYRFEQLQKNRQNYEEYMEKLTNQPPERKGYDYFLRGPYVEAQLARIETNFWNILVKEAQNHKTHLNDNITGLIIITCGFFLQMVGHVIQVYSLATHT